MGQHDRVLIGLAPFGDDRRPFGGTDHDTRFIRVGDVRRDAVQLLRVITQISALDALCDDAAVAE